MTKEEKARAYDEALERAKRWADGTLHPEMLTPEGVCELIFPQLAESEDERIRKEMVDYFSQYEEDGIRGVDITPWIAYLEKQKENQYFEGYAKGYSDGQLNPRQKEQKPVDYDHEMWKNCEANFEGGKKEVIDYPEKYGLQKKPKVDIDKLRRDLYQSGYNDGYQHGKEDVQKEQKSSVVEKLREISTPADENWFEIQKQWEKEDEQKLDTRDADDLQLLGFIYDLLNEIEWRDNWAMSKDECLRRLNNYRPQKLTEWSEEHIADIFEKVGLAKIVREQGNDALTNAIQSAMIELRKAGNTEWSEEDEEKLERVDDLLWMLDDYLGDDCSISEERTSILREEIQKVLSPYLKSFRPQQRMNEEEIKKIRSEEYTRGFNDAAGWGKRKEQEPTEWSEEDELMMKAVIGILDERDHPRLCSWLKSFRNRPKSSDSWKPSEEKEPEYYQHFDPDC